MQPHQEKESLDCEQATIWEEASSLSLLMLKLDLNSSLKRKATRPTSA